MRAKRILIVTVIALLALAIAFGVSAQDNSGGSNGQSGQTSGQQGSSGQNGQGNIGFNSLATNGQQSGLFPSNASNSFFTGLNGAMPRNATLLGVAFLDGFNTYTFDLNSLFGTTLSTQNQTNLNTQNQTNLNTQGQTNQTFNTQGQTNFNTTQGLNNGQNNGQNNAQFANLQQCGNVRVYKLSPEGVQDLWPNISCNGSLLSVQAGGRGHYILYRFNGNESAVNAPQALFSCNAQANANVNFGNRAGTQAQQGNVVCLTGQSNTGTTAGQGTIQGQQNQNATNQNQTNQTNQQTQQQSQQNAITATLQPLANSGVTGTVSVTPSSDGSQISVSANGLQAGTNYLSLYYTNSTCTLEADSLTNDMIGGQYTANGSGVGTTSGDSYEAVDEIHSVSVRLGSNPNQLVACASF